MTNETEYAILQKYNFISHQFTKYVGCLLYILCVFGTIMNILTFLQRTYHRRSCSLYLLIASTCDFIHLNLGPLSNILQYGFYYDWTITSNVYCKTKSYLVYVVTIISGTLTIFASIYQYMLSSKKTARWNYTRRAVGVRCIICIIFFWIIMSIPIISCSQRFSHLSHNEQLICSNPCQSRSCFLLQIIYICLLNGFVPPLIMMIFGLMTYKNVHQIYQRSQLKSIRIRKINEQLTTMLILQSIKSTLASIPYSLFNCYWIIMRNKPKSLIHQGRENLINQIVYVLFWSNYTSFFVYVYSSMIFRNQWIKIMKKIFCLRKKKISWSSE